MGVVDFHYRFTGSPRSLANIDLDDLIFDGIGGLNTLDENDRLGLGRKLKPSEDGAMAWHGWSSFPMDNFEKALARLTRRSKLRIEAYHKRREGDNLEGWLTLIENGRAQEVGRWPSDIGSDIAPSAVLLESQASAQAASILLARLVFLIEQYKELAKQGTVRYPLGLNTLTIAITLVELLGAALRRHLSIMEDSAFAERILAVGDALMDARAAAVSYLDLSDEQKYKLDYLMSLVERQGISSPIAEGATTGPARIRI